MFFQFSSKVPIFFGNTVTKTPYVYFFYGGEKLDRHDKKNISSYKNPFPRENFKNIPKGNIDLKLTCVPILLANCPNIIKMTLAFNVSDCGKYKLKNN